MHIRRFHLSDAKATHAIFREAVHHGTTAFYTKEQREAWAPNADMPEAWPDRMADQITYVAEGPEGLEGFFALNHDGHLDMAYVRPHQMGQGLAKQLYDACLADPAAAHFARLDTEASHLSRRFFERQGWSVVTEQEIDRFGVKLTTFRMEKIL